MPFKNVRGLLLCFLVTCGMSLCAAAIAAQAPAAKATPHERGVQIVQHGGYPELRVDGAPFFVHSAAFFYYRVPHDLWEASLERHRELGINTIDLYIPWNWHEPREGELDFDGHTHPRRNLRRLLQLITEKGFKLIARPGPVILNEWRHGGYPDWLLERPEYNMPAIDRLEGRYAPLTNLNPRDAEGAARGWLENATHMAYTRKWLAAVAKELAPYAPTRAVSVTRPGKKGEPEEVQVSGPLLFVQLDDDMAIGRTNYAGPIFWEYMQELRGMLVEAGLDVPAYINPTDMRVSAAGSALEPPIGAMGQWYMQPPPAQAGTLPGPRKVTAQDASTIEFFVEELKTQPTFPPIIIEYQAGWYTSGDDTQPLESPPATTLLSSRLLIAHGVKGLNYFPAQDGLTPAGYDTPWTNRHYRWDAALGVGATRQPRARAVERNGQLLELWSDFLAASHKRADFGLIYPLGAFPQEALAREDIQRVSGAVLRLARVAHLAGLAVELLDPQYQPAEQLLRHAVVLMPVFDPAEERFQLSEKAQQAVVEYVRRGGTLVVFPVRPQGRLLETLFQAATPHGTGPDSSVVAAWKLGEGRVLESSKDFYSWVTLNESYAENSARFEAAWAARTLREFLEQAGVHAVVKREAKEQHASELAVTQRVSNAGAHLLGARDAGRGLVSVTNLGDAEVIDETLHLLSPKASARGRGERYIRLRVNLPPGESLLLPLEQPLCLEVAAGERCEDEVVAAGAELLRAERDGKTLELTLYTPARATLVLRLARQPRRVLLDEIKPEANWDPATRQLEVIVPRGASPGFLRVVKVHLPYTPHVPQKPDRTKPQRRDYTASVIDAVRLPLADDATLPTDPPLVGVNAEREGQLVVQATNYDELGRDIDVKIEGPVRGSAGFGLDPGETRQVQVKLRPLREGEGAGSSTDKPPQGVLRSELQIRSGDDRRTTPIVFVPVPAEGATNYQFDFDRDGAEEWVLENAELRLIVSPALGGRALALVDKTQGLNLTTNVGAMRDLFAFTENPEGTRPERARGRYGLYNRSYQAEWVKEEKAEGKGVGLRLVYDAGDVYPAGARLEKIVRLVGKDSVEVDYRVQLLPREGSPGEREQKQAFIAANSLPVLPAAVGGERTTRFCWEKSPAPAPATGETSAPELQCELFTPGRTLEVPENIRRLEARTPGRFGIALEWDAGKMTIEMKNFSAFLKLQFAALEPGGEAGRYRVRYQVLPVD
jgi:hypothetical protein